jgi:trimethylamine--corrinoid protein Co-methyltransferase
MLAGANAIYGAGMLELGQTYSFEQLIIDNDIIAMCRRATQGITVNDDTLATDLIKEVGVGGNFLSKKHTLKWMDSEESFPILLNREMRGTWENKTGKRDLAYLAHEKYKQILKTHQVPPIDRDTLRSMEAICSEADKTMRK